MGAAITSGRPDVVPADMDELARTYYGFICGMVRKAGIPDQDVPDSVQYILERLGRTGVLDQYDRDHLTEHGGDLHRTRFSTFLGAKVLLYCRGERGRVLRRNSRELPIIDAADGDGLSALFGPDRAGTWDDYSSVEAQEFIARTREKLAAVPRRSPRDTCDLAALFDELVAEWRQAGGFSYAGICARFGISDTTAGAWMARLRMALKAVLGRPPVTIGGIALTLEQVAEAAEVLRGSGGTAVRQPLARAGHPLAGAEDGWYHLLARQEMRKFPELRTAPGSRRQHTGHVKAAVIHRLERILAEAGTLAAPEIPAARQPDPEPEVTLEEEFEARVWRGIRDAAEMDELKELARRMCAAAAS